jgi:hypothetical protein
VTPKLRPPHRAAEASLPPPERKSDATPAHQGEKPEPVQHPATRSPRLSFLPELLRHYLRIIGDQRQAGCRIQFASLSIDPSVPLNHATSVIVTLGNPAARPTSQADEASLPPPEHHGGGGTCRRGVAAGQFCSPRHPGAPGFMLMKGGSGTMPTTSEMLPTEVGLIREPNTNLS